MVQTKNVQRTLKVEHPEYYYISDAIPQDGNLQFPNYIRAKSLKPTSTHMFPPIENPPHIMPYNIILIEKNTSSQSQ